MNIGWVSQMLPYVPCRGGFRLYGGNLIPILARRHKIHLVSLLMDDDGRHLDWARQHCASVHPIPDRGRALLTPLNQASAYLFGQPVQNRRSVQRAVREQAANWDVIHVEGGYIGGLVPQDLRLPKVLSVHDAEILRCEEMLRCKLRWSQRTYYRLRRHTEPRYERLVYPRFDRCVVVGDRDLDVLRREVPEANVLLIPYGTDTEYFHPLSAAKERKTLVFHSHLGYAPNIEAVLEFANTIFPLVRREESEAIFHIVGARPGPEILALASRPGIRISADLPDLRGAVCAASVYVCAIRYGTGLKSKMLEAMAMGMPIVCYPGSTVGIACTHGEHLLVAGDPSEFAASVVGLLRNPGQAASLAAAGRRLVEEEYSWDSRAGVYEKLYEQLIGEKGPRVERGRG